jgi:two-component system, OmpR family, KDP operon response regulator KdpE
MTDEKPGLVLIVDDERPIRRFLRASLSSHGFEVLEAENGQEAFNYMTSRHPDLIILDLALPDMDGIDILKRLREWSDTPVIILSVRDNEEEKIKALDAGADDYLTKPFSVGELSARIRSALRHAQKAGELPATFQADELKLDFVRRQVFLGEDEINLTPTEYEILKYLIRNAGKVVTHHMLLREVWGIGYENDPHLVRVNISNLRHKIEKDAAQPEFILTEAGVGYRFRALD